MADNYDQEFQKYLILSKSLIQQLHDKEDRVICTKWITKLCNLDSDDIEVKKNRNAFFQYMLQVIRDGVLDGPFQDLPPDGKLPPCENVSPVDLRISQGETMKWLEQEVLHQTKLPQYMSHWSADRRTYVAAKPLPGCGALIYMAVTKDPSQGWDIPGKRKPFHC